MLTQTTRVRHTLIWSWTRWWIRWWSRRWTRRWSRWCKRTWTRGWADVIIWSPWPDHVRHTCFDLLVEAVLRFAWYGNKRRSEFRTNQALCSVWSDENSRQAKSYELGIWTLSPWCTVTCSGTRQIPDMQMKPLPLLLTLKASWSEHCTPSSPQKPISDESLCRPLPERARGFIMAEYSLAPFHLIRYAAPCLALLITSPLQPPVICSCAQDIFMEQ